MSMSATAILLQQLRHWAAGSGEDPHSDCELLKDFARHRDEAAFAALVRRHGPMVLNVCRRILPQTQDAEDAFQATFLVLLRRAGSCSWRESIGGWLHGVATRVALRLRADRARRAAAAPRTEERTTADPLEQVTARELLAAFDEELARLSERYRVPLVLCFLHGKTQEETARTLGCSLSTIRRRLERGRDLLHARLTRRGLELPAVLGAVLVSREASAVPPLLRASVLHLINGSVSTRVAVLAEGVLQAAVLTPIKATAAVVLLLGVLAGAAGLATSYHLAPKPPETENAANAPPEKSTSQKTERTDLYGDPLPPGALLRMGTVRFRASDFIGQIAYSPDGKIVAAGDYGSKIILYDAAMGRKLRLFQALAYPPPALAFAPDGKTLASADPQTIQIWDVATGKELRRFGVKTPQASSVHRYGFESIIPLVFSHNGKALAWVAADCSIHVWEVKTGKELVKLTGHEKPVRCFAFSADDNTLFSASGDGVSSGSVRVWQVTEGKELRKYPLHSPQASAQPAPLCFSPDSKTLAFAAQEWLRPKKGAKAFINAYAISLLDLETGEVSRKLEPQPGRMKTAIFSPDGKTIAAMRGVETIVGNHQSENNNRIQLWEVAAGKRLWETPAYSENLSQGPCHLVFSPDGKKLAASATASALHVWDVERGREHPDAAGSHHDQTVCVVFSPDGRTLASGSDDHTIALWDAVTGKQRLRLCGHEDRVSALAFSPDGKLLASASRFHDQTVRLWDLTTRKELRQYVVPSVPEGNGAFMGVATWVAFMAKGKILAAGGTDRKVRLWDVATGKEMLNRDVRGLPARTKQGADFWTDHVYEVVFTPDGRVMALSIGNTVHVADVAAGQRLFQLEKQGHTTAHLFLSPDGKTLACGGRSHSIRLVEIASGKDLLKSDFDLPQGGEVLAVAFASDGRTAAVAAGRKHGWICLFDVPTGKQLLRLQGAASDIHSLAFSPDGNKLASAQNDSTALVWDVSAARRKLPGRNLTAKDLERLWIDLRDADAPKAHAALWALVAAPDTAVPFLKEHLHPVPRIADDRLRRLIADLDADEFARREEASLELTKLGIEVEPALRKVLEGKPSLEMRRRVESLLANLTCQTEITPEALRQLRAIQVLEQIGSSQARQILASLAQGTPAAPATRDAAAAAIQRFERSSAP